MNANNKPALRICEADFSSSAREKDSRAMQIA
jgi:hypothetical protein